MMLRKIIASILMVALLSGTAIQTALADTEDILIKKKDSNDNVILLQLRLQDLGYYNYKITGYFGDFTEQSLKDFQKTNNISADGKAGKKTLDMMYSNTAIRNPIEPRIKPPPPKVIKKRYGALRDWFNYVIPRWAKYSTEKIKVVDFDTGKVYYVRRVGGHYHADVEPYSKKDCDILKSTYGGDWSWDRRAVIVYIKGEAIAGSINGMPHGYETVKNNGMTGQVCIHFLNSRTHIHNMRDPEHQRQIKRAAGIIKD